MRRARAIPRWAVKISDCQIRATKALPNLKVETRTLTLVIAHQKGGIIALVSDTGVIEHCVALGPDRQVPKICIINRDLAIGFAGDPDLANKYLRCLAKERDQSYRSSIDFLLQSHNDSRRRVDFLACYNNPVAKIVPIPRGRRPSANQGDVDRRPCGI